MPLATPVTIPVAASIVAVAEAEDQVAPEMELYSVVVVPGHALSVPVILAGTGYTVTIVVV